jgi:hypothetical protein
VLADDSPLRRLPSSLHRRQALFLDGLTFSIDMTSIAYPRLQALLHQHTVIAEHRPNRVRNVQIVMDAWSIVDSANRICVLAMGTPGLKHGTAYELFQRSVSDVETLRNAMQHPYGQVEELLQDGRPLWGSLGWVFVEAPDAKRFRTLARVRQRPGHPVGPCHRGRGPLPRHPPG